MLRTIQSQIRLELTPCGTKPKQHTARPARLACDVGKKNKKWITTDKWKAIEKRKTLKRKVIWRGKSETLTTRPQEPKSLWSGNFSADYSKQIWGLQQVPQPLFEVIWEEKLLPDDWTDGVIVKTPKKGALNNCKYWRSISVLSVPRLILVKIIIQRISKAVKGSD